MTAVRPPARFGHLDLDGDRVVEFSEKPQTGEGWINGAFFVLEPGVFDYIEGDDDSVGAASRWSGWPRTASSWPTGTTSFWQCMDTLRDKKLLEEPLGDRRARRGRSGADVRSRG